VHGDEISPIRTVQLVMESLDPEQMSGSVLAAFDISRPALEGMARRWPNSGRGIDLVDMNRQWPGNAEGASAPSRHAALLFEGLFRGNADFAIDFHSVATGMDATAFHFADMTRPEVAEMAMLYPIDQIFDNTGGYDGILANELIAAGIPALTPEVGRPRVLDLEMIPLFVEGTMNVLRHHGIVPGAIGRTGKDSGIFVAKGGHPVVATHGGVVELVVKPGEAVTVGQRVAVQYDAFGDVVAEYASRVAGQVTMRRTDATCEPGTTLMMILFETPAAEPETVLPE
jgi:predicted deacylase